MSDGGSVYKYSHNILDLRNFKESMCVRILIFHYNAAGEGKRPLTNGVMPAPKCQRKSAMKSVNPTVCNTSRREFIYQQFNGGLPGYQSFLHKYEKLGAVKVKRILGITLIHDI